MITALKDLHKLEQTEADAFSVQNAYFTKTKERLSQIQDLIPHGREKEIVVNGRVCRNVYFYMDALEKAVTELEIRPFELIHGDCTFSNMMLNEKEEPIFIDPRGYFGYTEIYGDPDYDWAKLYYSVVGNYDKFNRKQFTLSIDKDKPEVKMAIESNGWEQLEDEFFKLLEGETSKRKIKLLHAIIWLSLTTYAWESVDSILGAFFNGIYYLEEVL